ncbi:PH domain-containing protein [Clostridium botulinum]|uniref:Membrane protein n=1 Tax=Clostridium botulinum TaxID=1491 RepID=A0A9Q1ZC19_CLOBO|nr:PH domain-containing protein [Clostridium botulinum]KLU75136.1 membrane protein [Clostridium botulinum V891]KOA72614.1 membrane protein [Clostridium botulinum]KOA72997.1 membrane protein [Clostridium botulinum]KOA82065.1 membrane protein [Clostridium botulinum]KOA83506.1 membrane protein [Clostridium botulinum]
MEYNRLNENAKKAWFLSNLIGLIITGGILIGLRIYFAEKIVKYSFIVNIILGVILVILILDVLVNPIIEYKQWKYIITEDRIEFVHGIYFLTTTIIPIVRIQHIDIEEGPINRIYNLAKINIHTAGGQHKIEGLPKEKALQICEYIKDRIQVKVKKNLDEELKNQNIGKSHSSIKDGVDE